MEKLPETLESAIILKELISVRKDRLRYANMHIQDYFVVHSAPESVAVIAENAQGDLLVTQEYRHAVGKVILGAPGGLVNPDEEPMNAAMRELLEETGCVAEHFQLLGSCYPLPGLLAQKMYIFFAQKAKLSCEPCLELTETIQSSFIPKQELLSRLRSGADCDGVLAASLQFYFLNQTLM